MHIFQRLAYATATKLKTNQAAAKRFRYPTAQSSMDSFVFTKSGRNHNFAKKSGPRRIANRQPGLTQGYQTTLLHKLGL